MINQKKGKIKMFVIKEKNPIRTTVTNDINDALDIIMGITNDEKEVKFINNIICNMKLSDAGSAIFREKYQIACISDDSMIDFNNLTKEQAVKEHRKMWNWIADETEKRKQTMDKCDYAHKTGLDLMPGYELFQQNHLCFCCVYDKLNDERSNIYFHHNCLHCPIDWQVKTKCDNYMCDEEESPLHRYNIAYPDYISTAKYARQIANLSERNI